MKRPDWEPMPGRIFDFTERQQILVEAIEKITDAEVVVLRPMPEMIFRQDHCGFLSRPQKNPEDAENPLWREENGELYYVCDLPVLTAEERLLYPEFIRKEFPEDCDNDNILCTWCHGGDIDAVLSELYKFTVLLEMNWHLECEAICGMIT